MFIVMLLIKVAIFLICLICLINKTNLAKGEFQTNIFLFFTNLSILLCLLFYGIDIYYYIKSRDENILLLNCKGAVLLYTFITMIVYNFILVPRHKNTGIQHEFYSLQDTAIHCVVPILVLLEWLMTRKGVTCAKSPIIWLFVPFVYFIIAMIKGEFRLGSKFDYADSYYPYFFIDIDKVGLKKVAINVVILLVVFFALGYLIFIIDYLGGDIIATS